MSVNVLLLGILTLCCFLFVVIQSRGNYFESYEDLNKSMQMKANEYFEEMPVQSVGTTAVPTPAVDAAAEPVASPETAETEKEKAKIPAVSEEHKKSVEATEKIKQVQGFVGYVKEKFRTDRFENPVIPSHGETHSASIIQGFEMQSSANPGCDTDPRYIRKDSVPCYNCTLK